AASGSGWIRRCPRGGTGSLSRPPTASGPWSSSANERAARGGGRSRRRRSVGGGLDAKAVLVDVHPQAALLLVLTAEQRLRQRVLEVPQDRASKRPGAEAWLVAELDQTILGRVGDRQRQVSIGQQALEAAQLNVDDLPQVCPIERSEHDHVVDPVQKLGAEEASQLVEQHVPQRVAAVAGLEQLRVGLEDP